MIDHLGSTHHLRKSHHVGQSAKKENMQTEKEANKMQCMYGWNLEIVPIMAYNVGHIQLPNGKIPNKCPRFPFMIKSYHTRKHHHYPNSNYSICMWTIWAVWSPMQYNIPIVINIYTQTRTHTPQRFYSIAFGWLSLALWVKCT